MKYYLPLLVLFLTPLAHATDLTATCKANPKNTDGSAIPASAVYTFNLHGALQGKPKVLLTPTPLTSCSSVRKAVAPGMQCIEWTQIVGGVESDHSVEACKNVPLPKPSPPLDPEAEVVTTSTVAYTVVPGNDRLTFLVVGTVPLGTPCIATEAAGRFNVVPRAQVTFTGPVRPAAVLALCASS